MAAKIIVVDDDALLRRSVKYRLEQEGYAVLSADSGEEALTFATMPMGTVPTNWR